MKSLTLGSLALLVLATAGCGAKIDGTDPAPDESACATDACVGRAVAPLSGSRTTTRRPTFRFVGPATSVEVCADRACTRVLEVVPARDGVARPTRDLPPGTSFFRLRNHGAVSSTWQVAVGHGSAAHDSAWGTTLDVNGDGFADFVVPSADHRTAVVRLGGPHGPGEAIATFVAAEEDSALHVAPAGDVNGDGFVDLAVARARKGAFVVELHLGGPSGLSPSTRSIVPSSDAFGFPRVSAIGDVDGDGHGDVLLSTGQSNGVYVFHGSKDGLPGSPTTLLRAPEGPTFVGTSAASGFDLNGDGFGDVAVLDGLSGELRVHYGSRAGLSTGTRLEGGERFYEALLSSSDIDGDGYADLVVASSFGSGGAEVFRGGPAGVSLRSTSKVPATSYGVCAVVALGDVDGDGFADVLRVEAERGELLRGTPTGLGPSIAAPSAEIVGGLRFHDAVVAGDFDGDGFVDAAITTTTAVLVYAGGKTGLSPHAIATLPRAR